MIRHVRMTPQLVNETLRKAVVKRHATRAFRITPGQQRSILEWRHRQ